ncbi:NAD(P)-dependent oxidoreductase [Streptomyces lavendulae]|uniref:NAD(P)-dependent oxidoreductase n=1 Tax=Streptomyces lavendulae TaxID=1914 RepID=UPI0031EB14D3
MEKIAFLGLGSMGAPMAHRLLAAGHSLTVWNRTGAKAAPLVTAGARLAESPADAIRDADVVITMLADPAAAHAVAEAVVPALRPGTHWIDTSTVGPDTIRDLAARLPDGVTLTDAPVMGSVDRAEAGELWILAGGCPLPAPVRTVLGHLGHITECGAPGSGAALKLVLINAVIGGVALVSETLRLGQTLGLPAELVRTELAKGPLSGAVARTFAEASHFPISLAAKDVSLATAHTSLPLLDAVHTLLTAHPHLAAQDLSRLRP